MYHHHIMVDEYLERSGVVVEQRHRDAVVADAITQLVLLQVQYLYEGGLSRDAANTAVEAVLRARRVLRPIR